MRRLVLPFLMTLLLLPGMALAQLGLPTVATPTDPGSQEAPAAPGVGGGDFFGDVFSEFTLTDGLVLGLGLTLVAAAAALFFVGGAKFVNSGNVLENDARRAIFEHIQQHPGVHLRAAATQLNLSTTNVLWHLRKLEDANLVTSKKFEGYKVFYPVEGGVETKRKAIAASVLKNDNAQQILLYVTANPSAHQREIARALGVNHGTVRWHLRKLEEAELVTPVKKEHTTHYYVSELGHESMRTAAARAVAQSGAPPAPPAAGIPGDEGESVGEAR